MNSTWCAGNAGATTVQPGKFAEPGLNEQWKWGYKFFIRDRMNTAGEVYCDWLTELWDDTDVWICFGFAGAKMRDDGAHPNTAGEDYGAGLLEAAILGHMATQPWWYATPRHRLIALPTAESAYTKSENTGWNSHTGDGSDPADPDRLDHRKLDDDGDVTTHTVYIKFDARNHPHPVRRALVNLYATNDDDSQACDVSLVGSGWSEDAITENSAPTDAPVVESDIAETPNGSRSHPVTVDVTEVFNRHRGGYLSFRFVPNTALSPTPQGDPVIGWFARDDTSPSPNRGPQLVLVEKGVDEYFAYLERAVESIVAERLR